MPRLDQLEAFLAERPDDVFLNYARAMELSKLGRTDDAAAQFDRVIALDGKYCPAYFQKGRTLLAAGRAGDARAALQQGIEVAHSSGDAHAAGEMSELLASI